MKSASSGMDQMAVNIEKMRADMRWENRKFMTSLLIAAAALVGAGVGIGNLIWNRPQPPAPPPQPAIQQFVFPPGTVIQVPPAPAPASK